MVGSKSAPQIREQTDVSLLQIDDDRHLQTQYDCSELVQDGFRIIVLINEGQISFLGLHRGGIVLHILRPVVRLSYRFSGGVVAPPQGCRITTLPWESMLAIMLVLLNCWGLLHGYWGRIRQEVED